MKRTLTAAVRQGGIPKAAPAKKGEKNKEEKKENVLQREIIQEGPH